MESLPEKAKNLKNKSNRFSRISLKAISVFTKMLFENSEVVAKIFNFIRNAALRFIKSLPSSFFLFKILIKPLIKNVLTEDNFKNLYRGNKIPIIASIIRYPFNIVASLLPKEIKKNFKKVINDIFSNKNVEKFLKGKIGQKINSIKQKAKQFFSNTFKKANNLLDMAKNALKESIKNIPKNISRKHTKKIEQVGGSLLTNQLIKDPVGVTRNFTKKIIDEQLNLVPEAKNVNNNIKKLKNINSAINDLNLFNKKQIDNAVKEIGNVFETKEKNKNKN